ncbi:MAG: hypothetical protein K6E29_02485 [Cyanobacteria bacterium RUI128]|nr:hypothetical protein [Cyanobacteria bacterium RUI128]
MGFLLMSYEYQRATRETSRHEAEQIRLDNQVERLTKRIGKMESIFSKAKNQVNSNYQMLSQAASANLTTAIAGGTLAGLARLVNSMVIGSDRMSNYVTVPTIPPDGVDEAAYVSQLGSSIRSYLDMMITRAKEAETEAIEDQEEMTLDPINEKSADMEAQANIERQLFELWKARRDKAEKQTGEDIKSQMGGYGLS